MFLYFMYYNIMTKKESEVIEQGDDAIVFSRYCPILDELIVVKGWLREWELECEKKIIAKEEKEKAESQA